ncbi:MAG: TM2 domain-containing protein [Paludibacter sp.]|jgi:TM2 domain-containing membrane protein YozV|nr:TM2 domain-containing protein [Paludibacter sp.]
MKKENEKYCSECGEIINAKAEICPKCGVRQVPVYNSSNRPISDNRWITCLLLCWFLGVFGVHRFYTGHTASGIVQLLTLGGCGIWMLIDFIVIAVGNFKDADGNPIRNE